MMNVPENSEAVTPPTPGTPPDTAPDDSNNKKVVHKKPVHPATFQQKVGLAVFLALVTFLFLGLALWLCYRIGEATYAEVKVTWQWPPSVRLGTGPASFRYDATNHQLIHRGPIDTVRKAELRQLFEVADNTQPGARDSASNALDKREAGKVGPGNPVGTNPGEDPNVSTPQRADVKGSLDADRVRQSYYEAIDTLAYLADDQSKKGIVLLLILGAVGGIVGSTLRSLGDFVGAACYNEDLDLVIWWPLYVTRPFVAAILGVLVIVMFKGQLFSSDSKPSENDLWWLGIAVLAGFSTMDVTLRLRLTAKALFGVDSPGKSDKKSDSNSN
jgi:hypothetical protein